MKFLVVFVAVVAAASAQQFPGFGSPFRSQPGRPAARPPPPPPPRPSASIRNSAGNEASANIVRFDNDINPDGSYSFSYETDNGIAAQEQGSVQTFGGNPPETAVVAQGSYSYTSPEGLPVSLTYRADENGYQPSSNVLPVGPEIPPQIARALEYIARNGPQRKK